MTILGNIAIKYDESQVLLSVEAKESYKFNELEGRGSNFQEALEDLLEQVGELSI